MIHTPEPETPTPGGETHPGVARAAEVVRRLRDDCAWHAAQTHDSLAKYLTEEAAEFVDALAANQPRDAANELGDVLYQVLIHAAIAERDGEGYTLDSLADALAEKLIARHPHVFGDRGYMSEEELNAEWEHLKEDAAGQARGERGVFDGIPAAMPTLARAMKTVNRLRRARRDDLLPETVRPALTEPPLTETRVGEELLAVVARAEVSGVDADLALRRVLGGISAPTSPLENLE